MLLGYCLHASAVMHSSNDTSEMIHHHRASLSKQQTADLLICHDTQQDLLLSTV